MEAARFLIVWTLIFVLAFAATWFVWSVLGLTLGQMIVGAFLVSVGYLMGRLE